MHARDDAHHRGKRQPEESGADDDRGHRHERRDERARRDEPPAARLERRPEAGTRLRPDTREEKDESDLPDDEVRREGKAPDDRSRPLELAEDEADDERAAREAEAEHHAVREGERDHAEEHADHDAEGERKVVGFGDRAERVAEKARDRLDVLAPRDDADAVARFEDRVGTRHEVHVAPAQACDRRVEDRVEPQLPDRPADHVLARDEDPPIGDLARRFGEILRTPLAEEDARSLERLRRSHRDDEVAAREHRAPEDHRYRVALLDAAEDEARIAERPERLGDRLPRDGRVRDAERSALNRVDARFPQMLRRFLREVRAEELREDEEPEDHPEHAEGIRETVRDHGTLEVEVEERGIDRALQVLDRLDRGGERGGVRERPAEEAGRARRGKPHGVFQDNGDAGASGKNDYRGYVDAKASLAERCEEPRAGLKADRVYEEDEPYNIYMVGQGEAAVDGAEGDPHEENRRDAELEPGNPNISNEIA